MTIVELVELLATRCEAIVADFRLDSSEINKANALIKPQVIKYFLPPKKPGSNNAPDLPAVIVRPMDGEDTTEGATVKVLLLFGTFSEADDGIVDAINMLQRTRDNLLANPYLVDALGNKKVRIELPFKWKLYEEQPRPQWFVSLEINCEIALPEEQLYE